MLKITPDTNTLVSAAISKGNEYELLRLAELGNVKLILSPQIIQEFIGVISRPKFGFSEKQIADSIKQIIDVSNIIMPVKGIDIIKEDPEDNRILECAQAGKADYIVSGDRHLLNLKNYKSIRIIRTKQALDIIQKSDIRFK